MKLPDHVLAFKLICASNISDHEWTLAIVLTKDMKNEDMKAVLKGLFNKSSSTTSQSDITKQKEAFYSKGEYKSLKYPLLNNKTKSIKHNPLNKHGQISRCVVCNSKTHWTDKCPHKNKKRSAYLVEGNNSDDEDNDSSEEINIVLITEEDCQLSS